MKKVMILAILVIMTAGTARAGSSYSYSSVLVAGVNLGSSVYDEYPLASAIFFRGLPGYKYLVEINSDRGYQIGCDVYKVNSDYSYGYSLGIITQNSVLSNLDNAVYGVACYNLQPGAVGLIGIVVRLD